MDVPLTKADGLIHGPEGERRRASRARRIAHPGVWSGMWSVVALVMGLSSPGIALAFSSSASFVESPGYGGGGNRWFTGSPAEGYDCGVCHTAARDAGGYPFYVSGLSTPYQPETTYAVSITWPEFANQWIALKSAATGADPSAAPAPPGMGLVGEFVAESGSASGSLEFDLANAPDDEFCERTRPNLNPRYGAQVFQVRPGLEPLELNPDEDDILRCEARQLGQRCVVAMRSCGARALRFRWTAPEAGQGPIWFSAGFVAVDALTGVPTDTSAETLVAPMLETGTGDTRHVRELSGAGCAVVRGGPGRRAGAVLGLGLIAGLLWRRRRRPLRRLS